MDPIEVIRVRSDSLARQVYEFAFSEEQGELYLLSYSYQERLTKHRKWAICQQWRRDLVDIFTGGIDLAAIPIDPAIEQAALKKFISAIKVVKEVSGERVQGLSEMVRAATGGNR